MVLMIYSVSFWGQETEFRQSHVVVFCILVMLLEEFSFSVSFWGQNTKFRQSQVVGFFLHVCDGVKGIFLGVYNGDEVGETDSHGEDGWGFLSLCCNLGLLSGSGDGVMLISRGLFLKATDSTNGDGVCWENADDCDVQGEGGWGSIVCSCRFEGIGVDFFFW